MSGDIGRLWVNFGRLNSTDDVCRSRCGDKEVAARLAERGQPMAHTYNRQGSCQCCPLPGFARDFDCFDSENQWGGIVVFVGF